MNLKRRIKRFFTLQHRANAGFTLVELIVVIAIMGILAGVGTVGYAGYIKSANKKADMVLVGNIMRAIETGTNSTMFVNDDSFKMGELSFPVGFVALSTDGVSVITSETEVYPPTEGKCEWVTLSGIVDVQNKTKSYICEQQRNIQYTEVTACEPITYCKTHSAAPNIQSLSGTYVSGWNHEQGTYTDNCLGEVPSCKNACKKFELVYSEYPADAKTVTNLDALYTPSTNDASICEAAYANQYGTFGDTNIGEATDGDPIYDSISIAFGGSLADLKLTYDGWVNDEGVDYATFYASAPSLMEDMERLTGLLATASKMSDIVDLGLTQTYEDGEDVLTEVSKTISTTLTEEQWMEAWNLAATKGWDNWGFNLQGRENYSAARMAYNNAFASYLETVDSRFATGGEYNGYLTNIREFYSQELAGVGLPGLVNTSAFTSTDKLKNKINNDEVFNLMAEIYEEYKDSAACTENGRLIYNVMATFNQTSDVANAYADLQPGDYDIYDYYNSYVDEMAELYQKAQEAAGDGIVIIVSVENGKVTCTVSPSAANPREE